MTTPTSTDAPAAPKAADSRGDDQAPADFTYGHGRMPLFMKLAWLGFLAFGAWFVVKYLLVALAEDIG